MLKLLELCDVKKMARATLYLKRPITKFDVDLEENSLKAVGFINADEFIGYLAILAIDEDGKVKITDVMNLINKMREGEEE